ncbi:hypothetical protein [Sphingomonas sp. UYP23]
MARQHCENSSRIPVSERGGDRGAARLCKSDVADRRRPTDTGGHNRSIEANRTPLRRRDLEPRRSEMLHRSISYTRSATPPLLAAAMRMTPLEFELMCCSLKEASSLLAKLARNVVGASLFPNASAEAMSAGNA